MATFLFDSSGDWIAWRTSDADRNLYNQNGDWIGWFPWSDGDAVTTEGEYLGPLWVTGCCAESANRIGVTPATPARCPCPTASPTWTGRCWGDDAVANTATSLNLGRWT